MQEISQRMLSAGWILHSVKSEEAWTAISPENKMFRWQSGKWIPDLNRLLEELNHNERSIREGIYTPYTGTSRLTVPDQKNTPALLTKWLVQQGAVKGKSVLRARCAEDPAGDELLYQAGARRVTTLLQPWNAAPENHRHLSSHLLICEHVADVLPKADRIPTLKRILTHLGAEAEAYFSFYQMDALPMTLPHQSFEDGYLFSYGRHQVFMKPTLPGRCAPLLQHILGGFSEEINLLYNEIFCRW
ncbi:MAG: hypothetical protein ACO3N7_11565, partial [Kiritimatiellia bacterium]